VKLTSSHLLGVVKNLFNSLPIDIFRREIFPAASCIESKENKDQRVESTTMSAEDSKSESKELTAAEALTSLVSGKVFEKDMDSKLFADEDCDDETEHEEEETTNSKGFLIPQRFTKSGRKRAVPFPLKVSRKSSSKERSSSLMVQVCIPLLLGLYSS
jgi:hypothetical protein